MPGHSLQHSLFALMVLLFCLGNQGCGNVGPPIAPEEVGIKATVLEQQSKRVDSPQDSEDEQEVAPIEDEEPVLPPLRPIGTR